jgi:hypothetical protein
MRKILAIAVAVCVAAVATSSQAAPLLRYNTNNGNLNVVNDSGGTLAVVNIKSVGGTLNAPTFPDGAIPGAVVDTGDLPNFIALLNVPNGVFKLGPGTVNAGTQGNDLAMDYFVTFTPGAQPVAAQVELFVPEPATIAMAGLGMIGMVAAARRRRA